MSTLIDDLNWRYATKKFTGQKIPQEKLDTILEALRLTASSLGVQPWKFVVINTPELRAELAKHAYGQLQVEHCSHLIVLAEKSDVHRNRRG